MPNSSLPSNENDHNLSDSAASKNLCNLDQLPARSIGTLVRFDTEDVALETRLREIGFAEGDEVQPLHYGLFGKTPINVRLNGALIALRRVEARAICVQKADK